MSEINCNNCAISDFKESLCHRCDEMKRLGRADDIEKLLIKAFSKVDSPAKSDCISRQGAIDALKAHEDYKGYLHGDFEEILESLPSVQPEIIRCKDCKHQVKEWREDERFKDNGYWVHGCEIISDVCGYWALFGHNDEFCSEAERREDG